MKLSDNKLYLRYIIFLWIIGNSISPFAQETSNDLIERYIFNLPNCSVGICCVKKDSVWYYGTGFIFKDSHTVVSAYHGIKNADSIFFKACGRLISLNIDTILYKKILFSFTQIVLQDNPWNQDHTLKIKQAILLLQLGIIMDFKQNLVLLLIFTLK